ncbi:hypothetical protein [Chryseobacterium sp. MA9]|uniref:hypothetical protein n=1 Tax=Chryseobacterium sp. MA9 TaxID=2966625 RepID=UPI002105E9E1|nr:hypothetical protein [Chryseobacterium sp. MA9]UTX48815.1 hypothetical protein KIK00_00670 [Chryseobacterium sp. MA9]
MQGGIGFALTDALGEAFENLLSQIVYNFEDFLKKLWEKFRIAIKEIPNWYLKYGSNQYYRYKELGELMPDIITLLVPALKAGKASKAAEEISLLKNLSKAEKELALEKQTQKYLEGYYETLRKESDDFSKKLEEKTAESEVKEVFDDAENELDEIVNTKIFEKLKKFNSITNKYPNDPIPLDGKFYGTAEVENGLIKIDGALANYPQNVDYIITNDGKLLLGRKHHFLGEAKDVLAAGDLKLVKGKVKRISNLSGHYQPTKIEAEQFPEIFKILNVDLKNSNLNIGYQTTENLQGWKEITTKIK